MPWFERPKDPRRRPAPGREESPQKRGFFSRGIQSEERDRRADQGKGKPCRFSSSGSDINVKEGNAKDITPTSLIRRRIDVACLTCPTRTHFDGADANTNLLNRRFEGLVSRWITATVASCRRVSR